MNILQNYLIFWNISVYRTRCRSRQDHYTVPSQYDTKRYVDVGDIAATAYPSRVTVYTYIHTYSIHHIILPYIAGIGLVRSIHDHYLSDSA